MKTSFLIIALVAVASCTEFKTKVNEMMTANAMASDAVDTVEQLLLELKQSVWEEQQEHDARWAQQKLDGEKTIADLTAVANRNRDIAEKATAHREWVEGEIADSHAHIEWINNRQQQIDAALEKLLVTRCEANQLFIQQLKEHDDALVAIGILRTELARSEAAGEAPVFAQEEQGYSSKLQQYEHMFEVNAMKEFFQEGKQSQGVDIPEVQQASDVAYTDDTHSGRHEDAQHDNSRDELDTEHFESTVDTSDLKGTLHDKVNAMLDRLQKSLEEGAKVLEENEVMAALDAAQFQIKSAAEKVRLHMDHEKRVAYLAKLAVDLEVAVITEEDAWEVSRQCDADVVDAKNDLAAKEAFYVQETERRDGEKVDLDWIIELFKEQVASLGDELRNRIDDYVHDDRFDSMFTRKGDANVARGTEVL